MLTIARATNAIVGAPWAYHEMAVVDWEID